MRSIWRGDSPDMPLMMLVSGRGGGGRRGMEVGEIGGRVVGVVREIVFVLFSDGGGGTLLVLCFARFLFQDSASLELVVRYRDYAFVE